MKIKWTSQDIDKLISVYPIATHNEIAELFPNRTFLAIRKQAKKLGIKANIKNRFSHLRKFTDDEIKYICDNYYNTNVNEIANTLNKSVFSIRNKVRELSLTATDRRRYWVNDNFFDEQNECSMYWLGFIAADGCVKPYDNAITIQLSIKDTEHLQKLHKIIGGSFKEYGNRACLNIVSKKLIYKLSEYGIGQAKSLTIQFPDKIKNLINHFIRGYFDGDGSVYLNKEVLGYSILGTEHFLKGINNILPNPTTVRKRKDCKIFVTNMHGHKAIENLKWIKQNGTVFLERKWEKV